MTRIPLPRTSLLLVLLASLTACEFDADGDGYEVYDDCDDTDPDIHPGADEVCDGVDNDCDDEVDEGVLTTWYADADADGFGNPDSTNEACEASSGWVADATDCNDGDEAAFPGADETCNDADDDCDGTVDEDAVDAIPWYADADGDGYGDADSAQEACEAPADHVADGSDCDDSDAAVHPGAEETCNGADDDCDDETDEDATDPATWYADADGDGYGDPEATATACDAPSGYTDNGEDCDDTDDAVWAETDCLGCDAVVPADHATIQEAMDDASSGEMICVEAGTWQENLDFGGKNLWVYGLDGPDACVLDGGGADPVVTLASGESSAAVLEGFTVTNGIAWSWGGGIYVADASPTLRDLVVTGNIAYEYGGGIAVESGSPVLDEVTLRENWADYEGGGLYVHDASPTLLDVYVTENGTLSHGGGIRWYESDGTMERVTVSENAADYGGGLSLYGSSPEMVDLYVSENEARDQGGGLHLEAASPQLSTSTFQENLTYGPGGGVAMYDGSAPTLDNIVVSENEASDAAGMYVHSSYPVMGHLVLSENAAYDYGGALSMSASEAEIRNLVAVGNSGEGKSGLNVVNYSWLYVENGIVSGNEAVILCAGVTVDDISTARLTNVDVSFNVAGEDSSAVCGTTGTTYIPSHCNHYGNTPSTFGEEDDPTGDDGNLSEDPLYLDDSGSVADWDFHLDTTSPLVDAGHHEIGDPDGSAADIGAYGGDYAAEWDLDGDGSPLWWQPGPYDESTYPGEGWDCDDEDPDVNASSGCD